MLTTVTKQNSFAPELWPVRFVYTLDRNCLDWKGGCCKPCGVDSSSHSRKQITLKTNCCKNMEERGLTGT